MFRERGVKKRYDNFRKKYLIIFILALLIFTIMFFLFVKEKNIICGDGTLEGDCSLRKPYFCLEGKLIEKASICGCSEILSKKGDLCFSKYQTNPRGITLKYILRGEENEIDFVAYNGMVDYISDLPKTISYDKDEKPSRRDFKIKKINEEEQRELLLPLVTEIQNIAKDKKDQVRIAISLVQNIPYGESKKNITIRSSNQINYSRYAYEVLYEARGACEGKSELLTFLLKEMGYGVVLFYYPLEDHEAVGIKCPIEHSFRGTGYCFVETTGPSIVSNDQEYYTGWGRLNSEPQVVFISDGMSLNDNLYEYKDAQTFIKLDKIIEKTGELNIFRHYKFKFLKEKYGLDYTITL